MKVVENSNPFEMYNPSIKPAYTLSTKDYASLKEKEQFWIDGDNNPHLDYCRIDNDIQFKSLYQTLSAKEHCIFRGINEAKHKMFTSVQVHHIIKKLSSTPRQFVDREIEILKNINNHLFPSYFYSLSVDETDFLYLSLLQHYNAKTPFLDFSYSLNKALFFAQDDYKYCLLGNDISKYVSIYWIDLDERGFELIDIIKWYADQLEQALDGIISVLTHHPDIRLDVSILNWENFLLWADQSNRGEGINRIELGYITDKRAPIIPKITKKEYNDIITKFVNDVKIGKLTRHSALYNEYYEKLYNAIIQNVKLTNLNITAQEGCFILYNPNESNIPLEDFWSHNNTYLHLPTLHCVDISKKLIRTQIKPMLKQLNISKATIYPIEKDIVSSVEKQITHESSKN